MWHHHFVIDITTKYCSYIIYLHLNTYLLNMYYLDVMIIFLYFILLVISLISTYHFDMCHYLG
jgi:hypothetical protein